MSEAESEAKMQARMDALYRLVRAALRDTGQSRHCADFLLAWHNARENGGWDPTSLWGVDTAIGQDMLTVLGMVRDLHRYPGGLGIQDEMRLIWERWRAPIEAARPPL